MDFYIKINNDTFTSKYLQSIFYKRKILNEFFWYIRFQRIL